MKTPIKHDEWLFIQLKDADFAAEFLNAASQDGDPKTYLIALEKLLRLEVEWPLLTKELLAQLRQFRGRLPADFHFERFEANDGFARKSV